LHIEAGAKSKAVQLSTTILCGARFSVPPWASAHGPDGELKLAAAR
jgi:hypothetical protein